MFANIMSENKKHILFLPRWYPTRYDSMWGLFVRKHAEAASAHHQISVLYIEGIDKGIDKTEIEEQHKDGIYSLYIYYPKPSNLFLYFIRFIQHFIYGFKRINKNRKIDLVHVHILSRMGFLAYLSKTLYSTPYVITEHWSRYLPRVKTFSGKTRIALTRLAVKNASAVMPVTKNLEVAMKSYGLKNPYYKVIPNVVDDLFFTNAISPKTNIIKRIIHVSTFEDRSKNISGILKTVKTLSEKRQDFKMIFIGNGIDFDKMKSLAKNLHIDKHLIEFTGVLERKALVTQYQMADFMLINSHYENMPVVINEAFACGLAVLATNVGGISEHLNKYRGRLISPNKPEELIQELDWMLNHCGDFNSQEIRDYASQHFSYQKVGKELSTLYEDILKQ